MIWIELLIMLAFIFIGAKIGGIAVGYAGGAGVIILTMFLGIPAGGIPVNVILIIVTVIGAIAAMQQAGGLDYLVSIAASVLRKNPKSITYLAPAVTYLITMLAGTGHTSYALLPVITEVSKEGGVRPSKPLSITVIASQIAITASPISAALVIFSEYLEPLNVSYLQLLAIMIPSTFIGLMVGAVVASFQGEPLDESVFKEHLEAKKASQKEVDSTAKLSLVIFLISIVIIVVYATLTSKNVAIIENAPISTNQTIMAVMLAAALLMVVTSKSDVKAIPKTGTFIAGTTAALSVLGVAWLGDTFISHNLAQITAVAAETLKDYLWALSLIMFIGSILMYSQAATTIALMPAVISMDISPVVIVASFAATAGLFVLPTYPTLLAAVSMDDTGSTKIGKYVIDHPFMLPGLATVAVSVLLAFILGEVIL